MTRAERINKIIQEATEKEGQLKSWFGKSKVADAYGSPMQAHDHKDNVLRSGAISNQAHNYPGIISKGEQHTLSKGNDPIYSSMRTDKIKEPKGFYLKIEKPYHITHFTNWADDNMLNQMIHKGLIADQEYNRLQKLPEDKRTPELVAIIKQHGYDGVVYADYHDHIMHYNWLAFDENNQVKPVHSFNSANSVDNGGDGQESGTVGLD